MDAERESYFRAELCDIAVRVQRLAEEFANETRKEPADTEKGNGIPWPAHLKTPKKRRTPIEDIKTKKSRTRS
jgi:hypothetical protein